MSLAPILLTALLLAAALVHLLWAIGYWWPIRDETALARAVVGSPGITAMPGALPTSVVIVALLTGAWWPWFGDFAGPGLWRAGMAAMVLVFAARGIAPYLPAWRRLTPEQPFATIDRRAFGPLCLALAALSALTLAGGAP